MYLSTDPDKVGSFSLLILISGKYLSTDPDKVGSNSTDPDKWKVFLY